MTEISTPAPSATILLVREREALEVLMVKRHHQIDFASGALVFPGGKLSEDDQGAWDGLTDAPAGIDPVERALRIASVREAFEESGILLARRQHGGPFAPPEAFVELGAQRAAFDKGQASFRDAIAKAGLILALDALVPFAHWITPEGVGKRFDTRFFIAAAPDDQVEACDGRETVEAVWLQPANALQEAREGKWQIVFPTRLNIEKLAETTSVDAALAASRARKIVTVLPTFTAQDGKRVINIPPEAGYSITNEVFTR